jgi:hypothetical protein
MFRLWLSDLRSSLLAVFNSGGRKTAACIFNYLICTTNSPYLQEISRLGY